MSDLDLSTLKVGDAVGIVRLRTGKIGSVTRVTAARITVEYDGGEDVFIKPHGRVLGYRRDLPNSNPVLKTVEQTRDLQQKWRAEAMKRSVENICHEVRRNFSKGCDVLEKLREIVKYLENEKEK